jgi:diadenosine tetraphosphatase ApaH/serine/threonine PP2A family protein phosphatase
MPRIAIIADIHANIPALEAVVDDLRERDPDEILVGGDLVGRGPQGSRVVETIHDLGWRSIRGNHEDYVLDFRRHDVPDDWLDADEWAASRWMADELDDSHAEFIDDLPLSATADSAPELRLVHGSPRSYQEGIGEWMGEETMREHLSAIDESILVCAHTHRPLVERFGDQMIVNVGSVGLPFNGDPRAQYAILTRRNDLWEVELRRVEYDRDRFFEIYRSTGFLEDGGLTAAILQKEVRAARPYLVPFQKWGEITGREFTREHFRDFLEVYDPEAPMGDFFERIRDDGA